MRQVLLNLHRNAAKYNRRGCKVFISYALDGEYMRINVRDTGHGIPAEMQSLLVVPFER